MEDAAGRSLSWLPEKLQIMNWTILPWGKMIVYLDKPSLKGRIFRVRGSHRPMGIKSEWSTVHELLATASFSQLVYRKRWAGHQCSATGGIKLPAETFKKMFHEDATWLVKKKKELIRQTMRTQGYSGNKFSGFKFGEDLYSESNTPDFNSSEFRRSLSTGC